MAISVTVHPHSLSTLQYPGAMFFLVVHVHGDMLDSVQLSVHLGNVFFLSWCSLFSDHHVSVLLCVCVRARVCVCVCVCVFLVVQIAHMSKSGMVLMDHILLPLFAVYVNIFIGSPVPEFYWTSLMMVSDDV